MGAKAGIALKSLQWFNRGIQFLCSGLILGIYSYFLASLTSNKLQVPTWVRAVEGISGSGALYSGLALVLLCCLAGRKLVAFIAIVLDVAFAAAFIYVAVQNKAGASSCENGVGDTPFGSSTNSNAQVSDSGGPTFFTACKLQSACLAVSIVAIFFFIFSAVTEVFLARHRHKENRFGPSPANDYTSGYGKQRKGFLGFLKRSGTTKSKNAEDPNALPAHATPADMREPVDPNDGRISYATETTAVGEPPVTHLAQGGDMGGYRNKYGSVPTDDALPMNTPQPLANRPYGSDAYGSSHPYIDGTHAVSGGLPPAGTQVYPRTAENGRAPLPQNYRYSDGVYDA